MKKKIIAMFALGFAFHVGYSDCPVANASMEITYTEKEEQKASPQHVREKEKWEQYDKHSSLKVSQNHAVLNEIQRDLVNSNPSRLTMDSHKTRYIKPVYFVDGVASRDALEGGASSSVGGAIYFTSVRYNEFRLTVMNSQDMETIHGETKYIGYPIYARNEGRYNVYFRSLLASVLGHEMYHWEHRDSVRTETTLAEGRQLEFGADMGGMSYLGNTETLSYGGTLMWLARDDEYDRDLDETSDHPPTGYRFERIKKALEAKSGGRLELDWQRPHGFFIDGKHVLMPEVLDPFAPKNINEKQYTKEPSLATEAEHNFYVFGNIAWAMEHGLWKRKNIRIYDLKEVFPEVPWHKGYVIAIQNGNKRKLIDVAMVANKKIIQQIFDGTSPDIQKNRDARALYTIFSTLDE